MFKKNCNKGTINVLQGGEGGGVRGVWSKTILWPFYFLGPFPKGNVQRTQWFTFLIFLTSAWTGGRKKHCIAFLKKTCVHKIHIQIFSLKFSLCSYNLEHQKSNFNNIGYGIVGHYWRGWMALVHLHDSITPSCLWRNLLPPRRRLWQARI